MQVKDNEAKGLQQECQRAEAEVQRLERERDTCQSELRKITDGELGFAAALKEAYSLRQQLDNLSAARDAAIREVQQLD